MRRTIIIAMVLMVWPTFVDARPQRIVSLNLCSDQLLMMLADREQIASVSYFAADPELSLFADDVKDIPVNYGLAEQIIGFDPDLILTGPYTARFASDLLRARGVSVVSIAPAKSMDDVRRNVRAIAGAVDAIPRGEALLHKMDQVLQQTATMSNAPRALVLASGGATVGAGSFQTTLLNEAGFTNQAVQMGIGAWGLIGLEGVIEAAPDWLIIEEVGLRHNSVTKDFLTHRALARMVEQGHTNLLYIDARLWSCGTPRSVELVEQLRQVRQP